MKKRIEKGLPSKSNLTLKEQIFFIKNTMYSLNNNDVKTLKFKNKKYIGILNNEYGFFEEYNYVKRINIDIPLRPFLVLNSNFILKMIDYLNILKFNRIFELDIYLNSYILKDIILNKEEKFNDIVFCDREGKIKINSKFLYLYRLNKKTLSIKNNVYFYDEFIIIEFIRKKRNFIFYIKV